MAVPSARLILTASHSASALKAETDFSGRHEFELSAPGPYSLHVEREGFYPVDVKEIRVGETESLDVSLNHVQEYRETVEVVYSPPAIDPAKTTSSAGLSNEEILNIPYPSTRDIRNALPLIPGVLQDLFGQVHIAGSATNQTFAALDGFNISQPVSGTLQLRVSSDAVRSIDVQSSRTSAEFGKGSGGLLALGTGMGDDHFRFSATDFIPSVQSTKGLHIQNWTPRATFSGPLRKGRAWFYDAADGEYQLNIYSDLPDGADRNIFWRMSNLAKVQLNLPENHRLTFSLLANYLHSAHEGLSRFLPAESTTEVTRSAYLITAKDQIYLSSGVLVEVGFGFTQFGLDVLPMGGQPFVLRPDGTSGSFYLTSSANSRRYEGIAQAFLPARYWKGRHEVKLGANIERIEYQQSVLRQPFSIVRADGTLDRSVSFFGIQHFERNDLRQSGFVQDRWSATQRLFLELGLRLDWDQILSRAMFSPRLAGTYLLSRSGDTKLAAGIGLYYDTTDLDLLTRGSAGQRLDLFLATDGVTPLGSPVVTSFRVNESAIRAPRFLNWSVGLEQKLPGSLFLEVKFMQKRGAHGWAYSADLASCGANVLPCGQYLLLDGKEDRYDAVELTVRRRFKQRYAVLASYVRSAARSNAVLDSSLDNLLFSPQLGGPLPWDAPNRFLSWGWLPLLKGFEFAYSLDWRDGYPYSVVNQDQELVGLPNRIRFPAYFVLNLHVEKRFRFIGAQWAIRAGFNNVTSRDNPAAVDNNVDSPHFGTFSGIHHRAFTGRIRFLGRK